MFLFAYLILLFSLGFIGLSYYKIKTLPQKTIQERLLELQNRDLLEKEKIENNKLRQENIVFKFLDDTKKLFNAMGIEISHREIIMLNSISYLCSFLLVFLLIKQIALSVFLGSLGFFIPPVLIALSVKQRNRAFDKLFGDALSLISNTLRAGFSLRQALQLVAQEMPVPLCDEFKLLNQEIDWGLSLSEAMQNFQTRIPNNPVKLFVTAIIIQNEVGGSLAEIVSKIAESIRQKTEINNELQVLTSQGRISGLIIGIMPAAVGAMLYVINPDYIMQLFTTSMGLTMLCTAVLLEVIGVVLIKKMIKLEQ